MSDEPVVYAHAQRMRRADPGGTFESTYKRDLQNHPKYVIVLTEYVRRVMPLPICTTEDTAESGCSFDRNARRVIHNHCETTPTVLLGSREGFPPRAR